jgi:3-hydroxyisobutyrate dehydrogenase-like beta-hydroxyacid dehydrogenase
VFSDQVGKASAAKMCRSVMIKGMEALLTESLLAARHYGVESTVLDSLRNLFPGENWPVLARYMISRSLIHGRRRAEEMREVAKTVAEAGLDSHMSMASAQRQDWAAAFRESASIEELEPLLDAVLSRAKTEKVSC